MPAAPVGDGRMMLEYEQFRQRPFFVEEDGVQLPGPPYRLSATPAERRGRAPDLSSRQEALVQGRRVTKPVETSESLPFDGLRVVDLGTFWAGPYCTMYLGALGAEVIKIESTRRPDGFRFSGAVPEMGEDWYDRGGIFAGTNLDKRELTLDLSDERGRALLLRLVERADVVLENFSARVVEQLGIGYDELLAVKPDLVMVRMPGFGLEGPWRDYVGWAMVIEQATGMASVTGPPELPMHPGGLADPVIGMHAAVAVQAALEHRARTGEGQLIEVAQLETGANLTAELVVEWSSRGEALPRGQPRPVRRTPGGLPLPCRRTDAGVGRAHGRRRRRVARALCGVLGRDQWASDASLAAADGRRARHDELDEVLGAWTSERGPDEAVTELRAVGIPAARVLSVPMIEHDAQLAARGFFVELDHAKTGIRRYPGWPMHFSFTAEQHRFGAPTLGQHNREVLTELGLDDDEIATLEREGIIGDRMTA